MNESRLYGHPKPEEEPEYVKLERCDVPESALLERDVLEPVAPEVEFFSKLYDGLMDGMPPITREDLEDRGVDVDALIAATQGRLETAALVRATTKQRAELEDAARVIAWLQKRLLEYTEAEPVRWEYRIKDLHDGGPNAGWTDWIDCGHDTFKEYGEREGRMIRGRFHEVRVLIVAPKGDTKVIAGDEVDKESGGTLGAGDTEE